MKLRNHPAVWAAIGIAATIVLAIGVVLALWRTGDKNAVSDNAPLIAAVIALGGVGTTQMVSIALEGRRTREARDIEAQRASEAALQNYVEKVGELLIEQPLQRARPGDYLSTVVRAQTLAVLEGLDPDRTRILLRFLYESGLIYKRAPVVSLEAATLFEARLSGANLDGASLRQANLSRADLSEANLLGANLKKANLNGANLKKARLSDADLRWANLSEANLKEARLRNTDLSGANLQEAKPIEAKLSEAKLSDANLRWADLSEASLLGADLRRADLRGANLSGADLRSADLRKAKGFTNDELERQAASLEGATMPTRQKYEDWLKDKEDRAEDEEE